MTPFDAACIRHDHVIGLAGTVGKNSAKKRSEGRFFEGAFLGGAEGQFRHNEH